MGFIDPRRYGGTLVGPVDARPDAEDVAEKTLYVAWDERIIYAKKEGEWVEMADLTAAIPWDQILSKPDTFPPDIHDLDSAHSGALSIDRITGHDFYAAGHRKLAALGQMNEPF